MPNAPSQDPDRVEQRQRQRQEAQQHLQDLGARLADLRRKQGLSQEALAERAGLHRAEYGFIERGERDFGISGLWLLAGALDLSVSELVAGLG